MRRTLAAIVVLSLLVPAVAPAAGGTSGGGFASLLQTGEIDPDQVSLRATVDADGSARWRIAYRVRLDDENTTEAFESLRRDIEANESAYADQFAARMRSTVAAAENATGREMAVRNVSVAARRDPFQNFGVVVYSFTWEGFAAVDGRRLVVGDALAGLFLGEGTSLTIRWPEGYEVRAVDPAPDERTETSVTWEGARSFGPDQPHLVLAPASALPVRPLYLAVGALVLLAAAGLLYRRRRDLPAVPLPGDDGGATASPAGAGSDAAVSGGATADAHAPGAPSAGADPPPEELLSPRERVLRLVEENGGRMKQAAVTEALDWSAARTSQVVGDLRDAGELESFRLGRENVLRFPEESGDSGGEADGTGDADGRR